MRKIMGKKIKILREMNNVTQMQLAQILVYTRTGIISLVENGIKGMKHVTVIKARSFSALIHRCCLGSVRNSGHQSDHAAGRCQQACHHHSDRSPQEKPDGDTRPENARLLEKDFAASAWRRVVIGRCGPETTSAAAKQRKFHSLNTPAVDP